MFTKVLAFCGLVALSFGMSSCTPEQVDAVPSLKVGTPVVNSAVSVDVPLQATALSEIAYLLVEQGADAPVNATVLFKNGVVIPGNSSVISLTAQDGLVKNKSYDLYVAASISASAYYNDGEIFSFSFTTPGSYAEDVQMLDLKSDGANVYVTFPEALKEKGARIKWGIGNIAMLAYRGNPSMPESLHNMDGTHPSLLIAADTLLEINTYHVYDRKPNGDILYTYFSHIDENGVAVYVEATTPEEIADNWAEPQQNYEPIAPGEPCVLMLSEVAYADCQTVFPTIDYGWGPGWYKYPYDYDAYQEASGGGWLPWDLRQMPEDGGSTVNADDYWYDGAWYKRIEFQTLPPQATDASVDVDVSGITTDNAKIVLTPNAKAAAYAVGIFADVDAEYGGDYQTLLSTYLNNNESYVQWFSTSVLGSYMGFMFIPASEGPVEFTLDTYFLKRYAGGKYHVIVTAVESGSYDEYGQFTADLTKQNFQHITFNLEDYSKPEPSVVVTAHEPYSPYFVKFNIKNPDLSNPIAKACYAANYEREFKAYLSWDYTLSDIVGFNEYDENYFFSAAEIAKINSAAGLDVEFDSRENAGTMMVVKVWNQEGRASNPDAEGAQALATAYSMTQPDAERVEFTKLDKVAGTWTATATVEKLDWEGKAIETKQMTSTVTIGDLTSPAALTEEVYNLFEQYGVTREETDTYFAEFKKQEAAYNASVRGQNRVLCAGWNFSATASEWYDEMELAMPWDLFVMEDYNASLVDYLYYEFGPKWFLQENAEGDVFVPVNMFRIHPLTAWMSGQNHYLCLGNAQYLAALPYPETMAEMDEVSAWPNIPVEISADGNTITIKGVNVNFTDGTQGMLYPNVVYQDSYSGGISFIQSNVISDVVLTRSTATPSKASAADLQAMRKHAAAAKRMIEAKSVNGEKLEGSAVKHISRTVIAPRKKAAAKKLEVKQMTGADIKAKRAEVLKAMQAKLGIRK